MVIDMTVQQIIVTIIFAAVGAAIVGLIIAAAVLAKKNLRAPKLTADATLIEKKTVREWTGKIYRDVCRLTFRLGSGETISFDSAYEKYEWLDEGDTGALSYQGSILLGFEKNVSGGKKKNQWTYTEE